jgi:hypothetical protein
MVCEQARKRMMGNGKKPKLVSCPVIKGLDWGRYDCEGEHHCKDICWSFYMVFLRLRSVTCVWPPRLIVGPTPFRSGPKKTSTLSEIVWNKISVVVFGRCQRASLVARCGSLDLLRFLIFVSIR